MILRLYRRDSPPCNGMINSKRYQLIYGGKSEINRLSSFVHRGLKGDIDLKGFDNRLLYGDILEVIHPVSLKGFYMLGRQGIVRANEFNPDEIINKNRENLIYVMICEPLRRPYFALIPSRLSAMQHIVGGLIEPIYLSNDDACVVWCNEEFLMNGSKPNRPVSGQVIHGTFFVAKDTLDKDGEYIIDSLDRARRIKYFKKFFSYFKKVDSE